MILNEDKVRRMIDLAGLSTGSSGGSGGGGGSIPAGSFVTPDYYSQNFGLLYKQVTTDGTTGTVTTAFELAAPNMIPTEGTETDPTTGNVVVTSIIGPQVKNALVIGNIMMVYDETNNAIKVVNRDGTTAANFYATGGVSALGYSPGGGGGGGADLNLLLDNINSSNIGNIAPTSSEVGKCLVYNGNNQWAWATPGGGGGTGTVTSITAGTGLSGGTITTSGTIAISSNYQARIALGETAYGWGNHADAGYLTSADLPALGISNGVITIGNNTITPVTQVAMTVPTGFTITGSPVTKSGTLALGFTSGYSLPTTAKQSQWDTAYSERHTHSNKSVLDGITSTKVSNWDTAYSERHTHSNKSVLDGITSTKVSNWDTAYGWGNHANAGYMLRTEGMRFLAYDAYVAARFVTASGASDTARAAKAQGDGYIEWWSSGGYFNHEMGFIRAKGNVEVGTSTSDTAHYLQIGGGRLYWDSTNNALYVQKVDSQGNVTAANFYATGGVSALGMSVGGTPSMNALTLQTLTVNGSATIASLTVRNTISSLTVDDLDVSNNLYMNGCDISMDGGNINNCGTLGADAIETGTLLVGSGSELKKIQWDGTYLQVQIGTTTYKFRPDATA